jgi:hypothetical protein
MSGRSALTAAERADALRRLRAREPYARISVAVGVSERTLRTIARDAGIPSRYLSPAARLSIVATWVSGAPAVVIAARHGITARRVQQLVAEAGASSRGHVLRSDDDEHDNATGDPS